MEIDILIHDGSVITMDAQRRVLQNHSVAIKAGKILAIGPAGQMEQNYHPAKTINAHRKAIMPGLVDAHAHAGTALIKQVGERLPGANWRETLDFIAYHTSAEWWHVDSLHCSLEKLKTGTTTSLYMLGCAPRGDNPEYAYENAKGVDKVGIRSICAVGPSRPPWPHEYTYWKDGRRIERLVSFEETFEATDEMIGTWNARTDSRVKMWTSASRLLNENPNDPVYDPANAKYVRPQAEGIRALMDKHDVGFHVHAYGTAAKFLDENDFGLLGPQTVFAHGWPFDLESVEIIARTNTRVAHCPRAQRAYLNDGRLPLPELIDAGVTVGLGTDFCGLDRSWNLWEDIYFSPRLHRRKLLDETVIPPGKILEMATIDGARALGMDDRIGSLEPGKEADVIVVNLFQPHLVPFFMEVHRLAYYARGSDVETVIVAGQVLMEDRKVLTVDENDVLEWADEEARHTIRLFGLEPLMERDVHYWNDASRRRSNS
jgi:cytosine/adenosine deaminase-related metal-dependent hydrolase